MDELTGIAMGHVNRLGRQAVGYAQEIDRANGEVRKANEIIERKNQIIEGLEARIAELELALKVKEAVDNADQVVLAKWAEIHPQSPMREVIGKRSDNKPLTKGYALWVKEFDAALRKRGITNPEAYRIS